MRMRLRLAIAVSVVAILMMAAAPALAGDPARAPAGAPATGGPVSAEEQALTDQKHRLADDYLLVRSGDLDPTIYAKEWAALIRAAVVMPTAQIDVPEPIPQPPMLDLTEYAQVETYYCGPATAREILGYLGITTGPHSESVTQRHVARNPDGNCEQGYLCTNTSGTAWYYSDGYKRPMKTTLNTWADTSWYVVNTGSDGYISALVFDIDYDYPIAMLVRELDNTDTPHLVGHPKNIPIGHWIAVHGYDFDGSWSYYADSVHGTTFWTWSDNVPAHSWIRSGNSGLSYMMDTNPGTAGYIW